MRVGKQQRVRGGRHVQLAAEQLLAQQLEAVHLEAVSGHLQKGSSRVQSGFSEG